MPSTLPSIQFGAGEPAVVLLHSFGASKREWLQVGELLSSEFTSISLDLPGFGEAAGIGGYTVTEMCKQVSESIGAVGLQRFVLVGHSLSGKLAMVAAAQRLAGLEALVLVTPSPPSPEPISPENRAKMLGMKQDRATAEAFIDGVTATPLSGETREQAVQDYLQCSKAAWVAWLDHGSNEDWSAFVGVVNVPALVITGQKDPALPASIQTELTLPHLSRATLTDVADCGHLPTREQPHVLAELIAGFMRNRRAL